jgi:hypothetical protein
VRYISHVRQSIPCRITHRGLEFSDEIARALVRGTCVGHGDGSLRLATTEQLLAEDEGTGGSYADGGHDEIGGSNHAESDRVER